MPWCGAWSRDGKTILSGARDGTVRGWPVDAECMLELARSRTSSHALDPEQQVRVDRVVR